MPTTGDKGSVITTFAGGPRSGSAQQTAVSPDALAVHGNFVYIADQLGHAVYRLDIDNGQLTVVAGMGFGGCSGDGGQASEAVLNMPGGLAVDADGNLFIADTRNDRIRKVDTADGTISTIAGVGPNPEGDLGFSGDGGKAADAHIDLPTALAIGASGTLYFADSGNSRIRAIGADGTIATVAGSGGVNDEGELAIETQFVMPMGDPYGIAVDAAGNILIPEPFNRRVRKVDVATGRLTTVLGSGDFGSIVDSPNSVAVDSDGNVYVADTAKNVVLRVGGDGSVSTVAGNGTAGCSGDSGPAPDAQLARPGAVAVDSARALLVADRGNYRVRRVDPRSHAITTVAGNGPPLLTFIRAQGLAVDQRDNVFLTDMFNRVYEIDGTTGEFSLVAGSGTGFSGDGGPARDATLNTPWRLSVDSAGNLYISDHDNRRVRKVDRQTGIISTVAGNGRIDGFFPDMMATRTPLYFLLGTCVDGAGNLYIADAGLHCVQKVDAGTGVLTTVAGVTEFGDGSPGFSGDGRKASKAHLNSPSGLAVDAAANLYIADTNNHRIRRVDAGTGVITTVAGGGDVDPGVEPIPATAVVLGRPVQLAFDHDGTLLVSDTQCHRVLRVDLAAKAVRLVAGNGTAGFSGDGGPGPAASLRAPEGIAVDGAGRILIADTGNQRLRRVEPQT